MKLKKIMSRKLVTCSPQSSVYRAACLMKSKRVGTILVKSRDNLHGILTERDVLVRLICKDLSARDCKVKSVMSTNLITISANSSEVQAAYLMQKHKIKKLPVFSNDKLVGIVTQSDLIKAIR